MHKSMNLLVLKKRPQHKLLNLWHNFTAIHQLCSFQGWIVKCGQILVTEELDRSYNA